jgi:hypothetical protein
LVSDGCFISERSHDSNTPRRYDPIQLTPLQNYPNSLSIFQPPGYCHDLFPLLHSPTSNLGWSIGVHEMPDILAPQTKRRRTIREKQCTHCGRTFKRTEHLERHVRTREAPLEDILYRNENSSDPNMPVKIQRRSPLHALAGHRSRDEISSRDITR